MKNRGEILNTIITTSIALAIASSFFIIPNFHFDHLPLPQPFYFFLAIVLVAFGMQLRQSDEYRDVARKMLNRYLFPVLLFFFCIALNFCFFFFNHPYGTPPSFAIDVVRVLVEILFAFIVLIHLIVRPQSRTIISAAFAIPLTLVILILFRNIDAVRSIVHVGFFSEYALAGFQYNTTSLGAWLVIAFALSASFLFYEIARRRISYVCIYAVTSILIAALIWWTNSRGALLGAFLITLLIGIISWRKQKTSVLWILGFFIVIFPLGLALLPIQAKGNILVRYYPQYRQEVSANKFIPPSIATILKSHPSQTPTGDPSTPTSHSIISSVIPTPRISLPTLDLTNAQDRQDFWPRYAAYMLNHPFGMYGPKILPSLPDLSDGEHNSIMQAGRWGGWGAMAFVILFIFHILKLCVRLLRKSPYDPYSIGIAAAYLATLILILLNSFLHLKTFWVLSAMIIAYSFTDEIKEKHRESHS